MLLLTRLRQPDRRLIWRDAVEEDVEGLGDSEAEGEGVVGREAADL